MCSDGVLARETERGVIDGAGQRFAGVLRMVEIGVEEYPGLLQVQVGVILTPGVAEFGGVERTADGALGEQVGAEKCNAASLGVGAIAIEVAFARRTVLVLERREMTGHQIQVVDFSAVQQKPVGVFRLQAFVRGVEYRGFDHHFTEGQGGSGGSDFQRATATGVVAFATTVIIYGQQSGPGMPLAAIQFQSQKGMSIQAKPKRTGCETGFKSADKALSPFRFIAFACRRRGSVIAIEVKVAAEHVKRRAVQKPLCGFISQGCSSEQHR